MKLVPLSDRVVLKQCEAEETTKSGIILTSSAQEKPQEAEVIAVGPGGIVDGKEVTMQVKEGQKVIYSKYAGTEVKSLRMGKCSIKESFIRVENGEVYIYGMHISPYEKGNIFNKDPLRIRKLLLHRYEINKIEAKLKEKGLTLVPLKVYFKDSLVKVEIGMARGKKLYDKRQDIAKKDQRREAEREFKVKNLY